MENVPSSWNAMHLHGSDTFNATRINDWQHTIVTTLLLATGYPKVSENHSPEPPIGSVPPKYLDVDELIRRQKHLYLYSFFNEGLDKANLKALQDPLINFAGRQWSSNLIALRLDLMRICDIWSHVLSRKLESKLRTSQWRLNTVVDHWWGGWGGSQKKTGSGLNSTTMLPNEISPSEQIF
ncbi:serine/threonine protein kinase [Penicillium vulpinum]|uniref:serine/threonine protein kinase n=1 Tax=Penicillium vulpinum TaxID=29845 RepID=UPI0025489D54|nr:serine/threonine protein kinase [Penicillium vulpinum]KAJ5963704.1 serine/threonine protein kinase [Penicillium vulpinum]